MFNFTLQDDNPQSISEKLLNSYIKDNIIIYHGELSDVRALICMCSVFVLPSTHREGVPHAALESMSMGRPVIVTESIGCKEVVIDGVNGFSIKRNDINDLVNKMLWFINHPCDIKIMGKKSREYCEERFDVQKVNLDICNTMHL
ncbi:hypothetical protein FACS1894184_06000 [Clostridia bacterium]|nr:hypothetical protein FACS1894184_06000 [Clostridia bacterium]